ncbi:CDK-activating kinase assembly protein [Babesia ovis]|uniref:CDK-activating kinase assembly protein n=1 Tax=Babesia ovis TaxID=5869 RepID=A0A9W5TBY1_BABOV|nr:CDK-activating kinase assembly protein [Babesia ovis]
MDNECPICLEIITPLSEKRLLVSKVCEHKICDQCAEQQLSSQVGHAQCAICRCHISRESFAPYDNTQTHYNAVKEARKRVLQIYNDTRSNFKDTPEYDKFLETRETIISNLAAGRSDPRWEIADATLRNYESQNAARISSNMALQQNELRKRVKHIVEKEKTFYEMVDKGAPFNLWKVDELVHTLQRTHASFFNEDKEIVSSTGECKPLNAAIRSDADIPRRMMTSRDEVLECDVAGGYDLKIVNERCQIQVDIMLLWNLV